MAAFSKEMHSFRTEYKSYRCFTHKASLPPLFRTLFSHESLSVTVQIPSALVGGANRLWLSDQPEHTGQLLIAKQNAKASNGAKGKHGFLHRVRMAL